MSEAKNHQIAALAQLLKDEADASLLGADPLLAERSVTSLKDSLTAKSPAELPWERVFGKERASYGGQHASQNERASVDSFGEEALVRRVGKIRSGRDSALPGSIVAFSRPTKTHVWVKLAMAASVILSFGGAAYWIHTSSEVESHSLSIAEPITFDDGIKSALRDGRVRSAEEQREVKFSDGSLLTLQPTASLRVRDTAVEGATVVLESGTLEAAVVHREHTRWSILAGPYEIKVIGTKFAAVWQESKQSLQVHLHEGAVEIVGTDIEGSVRLESGQSFQISRGAVWTVHAAGAEAAVGAAIEKAAEIEGTETVSVADSKFSNRSDSSAKSGHVSGNPQIGAASENGAVAAGAKAADWSQLLSSGKFADVVSQAKAQGIAACLASSCTPDQLKNLADAARYSGEPALAEQTLLRLRVRSPGHAARAAFQLGSLQEARGNIRGALEWYQRYASEAPAGVLAAEALSGQMRCSMSLGQLSSARTVASEYLRRFPRGAAAKQAQQLLDKP